MCAVAPNCQQNELKSVAGGTNRYELLTLVQVATVCVCVHLDMYVCMCDSKECQNFYRCTDMQTTTKIAVTGKQTIKFRTFLTIDPTNITHDYPP